MRTPTTSSNDAAGRLKEARLSAGFESASAAARSFGWNEQTYYSHENGTRGLRRDSLQRYARAFKVSADWLVGLSSNGPRNTAASTLSNSSGAQVPALIDQETTGPVDLVPVYGVEASAGHGRFALDDYDVTTLAFPREYLRDLTKTSPKHLAILSVKGDSMEPTLPDDSLVMIDTTKRDLSWDGIFVLKDDGDGILVKRIGRAGRKGHVKVISDNERYDSTERPAADLEIIGRVLWYGRKV